MLNQGENAAPFSRLDLNFRATVVAAVSGGSDSIALLVLCHAYLKQHRPDVRLIAATVDHGLRAASADEARGVAALCGDLGIEHRTLVWLGDKPTTGIQAEARLARHRLLATLAETESAAAVLTGHTRDDQAETVLMRGARAGGLGSAGIAPATLFDGKVWFLRPLLGSLRDDLRTELARRTISWVDDPSNADMAFERARLRASLQSSPDGIARREQALVLAATAAGDRVGLGERAAELIERYASQAAPGLIRLERAIVQQPDIDAVQHALRVLIAVAGGLEHLPEAARVAGLGKRLKGGTALRATLGRTLVDAREAGIFFLREDRSIPLATDFDEAMRWDGRFEIGAGSLQPPIIPTADVPPALVDAASRTLPVVGEGRTATPIVAPWARFLPSFDLSIAHAAAKLIGARAFPPPPYPRHIATNA